MRNLTLIIPLLLACVPTRAADFKIYAILVEDTRVNLSDGAVWQMDKGDVFPIEAYKNQQKNVVLRLAGATFMTETAKTRVLKPEEVQAGIEVYRKNVRAYLDSTSKKIEKRLIEMEEKKSSEKKTQAPTEEAKAASPASAEPKKP
jgi:hypothetical protein